MEVARLKASMLSRRTESAVKTVLAVSARLATSSGDCTASLFMGVATRLG
jgi:hypothetical protein